MPIAADDLGDLSDEQQADLQERTGKMRSRTNRFGVMAGSTPGQFFIDDDDFHWDALLRVCGDFESDAGRGTPSALKKLKPITQR